MSDMMEIARKGFKQKIGTYLVMTLLVAFTVAGYLVVSSYWKDAASVSTAAAEPLNFPYAKATVLFAWWTNPPMSPDEEFPPPRKYAPVFNDAHLREIAGIRGVLDLTVALEEDAFNRYGSASLLSVEAGAPMWQALDLVSGRLPENATEVLVPDDMSGLGAQVGQVMAVKVPQTIMPRSYRKDNVLVDPVDPEPLKKVTITGVYKPFSSMVSGLIGYLPVNRVDDYPVTNPGKVQMPWPVPNTIFLHLADPSKAESVLTDWRGMYRDYPGAQPPLVPPVKVEWTPSLPEALMRQAASDVATPLFTNTIDAFGLGAIGIFASMFVSFLDRRRELGIMKTLGIDNSHTSGAVSMETIFAGVLGTVLGAGVAAALTGYCLKGVSGNSIAIPWTALLTGTIVAAGILLGATYIPRAMAKQGTVMELLYGRPIPIYRQRR